MAKKFDKNLKELQDDVFYFICMCTESDKNLFMSDPKEKTIEDFGRFICIGMILRLRGVFLHICNQFENVDDISVLLNYLDALTFDDIKKWTEEFIKSVREPLLKKCAQSFWDEQKEYFSNHKFTLSKLI